MTEPLCHETQIPLTRGTRPINLSYKGQDLTVDMPGWYCETCDESLHSGEDMKISDRALNQLKARVEGLLDAKEIRRIRKKLGWSQAAAGTYLGGGPRAFQKYESGDLLPSRAICSALILSEGNPDAVRLLEARFSQRLVQRRSAASCL
jgi:HTH-type transcriptional regulator/antitoxin MqsA